MTMRPCRSTWLIQLGLTVWAVLGNSGFTAETASSETVRGNWTFSCAVDNDLYRVVSANGVTCRRLTTAAEAIRAADDGSGVLILADGYPEKPTSVDPSVFEEAEKKRLRLYVEYPGWLPDVEIGTPQDVKYERGVVHPTLRRLRSDQDESCW